MARPRAYNHGIRCPECGSRPDAPERRSQGRQLYRCGDCGRYYTHGGAYTRPGAADREPAVDIHGAGVSQSAIARLVGATPPAVGRWVKKGALPRAPDCAAESNSAGKAQRAGSRRR